MPGARVGLSRTGAVSALVAGGYALLVVQSGWRLVARATWPVQLGYWVNGDVSYPQGDLVVVGALVVVAGACLLGAVAAMLRGSEQARRITIGFLVLVLVAALIQTGSASTVDHCVEDTYSGVERCISPVTAARRDALLLGVPALLALVGIVRSRPDDPEAPVPAPESQQRWT